MAKQIKDFVNKEESWKMERRTYYLDDYVDNDPTKICPRCDYRNLVLLHTHNPDGKDYRCSNCKLEYEIIECNREDFTG